MRKMIQVDTGAGNGPAVYKLPGLHLLSCERGTLVTPFLCDTYVNIRICIYEGPLCTI